MIPVLQAFSDSYAQARTRLLLAALTAQLDTKSFMHPLKGAQNEDLALDAIYDGPTQARKLLIISSGSTGPEGLIGSGLQNYLLNDQEWRYKARAAGVAVLYVHGINPWGFSHIHYADENNVIFSRNFVDFTQPLPENRAYAAMYISPTTHDWPPPPALFAASDELARRIGLDKVRSFVQRGQYEFADGLYYGGTQPNWSNQQFRAMLRSFGQYADHIVWLDVCAGYGTAVGINTSVSALQHRNEETLERSRNWWAAENKAAQILSYDDPSAPLQVGTGMPINALKEECRQAQTITPLNLYFASTTSMEEMRVAWLGSHWRHVRKDAPQELRDSLRDNYRRLCTRLDDTSWAGLVISQGRQKAFGAVDGLSALSKQP